MKNAIIALLYSFSFYNGFGQDNWKAVTRELIVADPPFKACHASSIVELSSRELMVAFFAGSAEGAKDVCIWLTKQSNRQWEKPYVIADGVINDSLRYPCWNPVLFKGAAGKLFLFYKVGPNPRQWWGMVQISTDDGETWSRAEKLP